MAGNCGDNSNARVLLYYIIIYCILYIVYCSMCMSRFDGVQ